MSCYFVAQIDVHDEEEYGKYVAGADAVFAKYNGRYLAVDDCPEVIEGAWNRGRIVIIEFPDEAGLKRWYGSAEYQAILRHRLKAAVCDTLVVKGLSSH